MSNFGIKRLYTFVLQSFLPLFVMTFFICLFIVLMQFLWRYIDDLVGKGLGVDVLGELFFYAALTMIPMALPLAILLASLMTFGNLGEHFELTAMKASGVSLIRVMKPLIVLMVFVAIGAFFFQNNVLPVAQTKMWTLLYSMRQKSPELEIPEGVFYDQIPGFNLYVESKNRESGHLYDVMIYDLSRGFDNSRVILADSAKLAMMEDKTHLFLRLWQGESFENMKDASSSMRNVPYRRESFSMKDILVPFDANFNRMDEEGMRNQYVGKNIAQLRQTIDSLNVRVDSVGRSYGEMVLKEPYFGLAYSRNIYQKDGKVREERVPDVKLDKPINVDSMFNATGSATQVNYLRLAINRATAQRQEHEFRGMIMKDERKQIRRHDIEMQKKFTLSFACIIFFFIGAPLGAIIRKGGLGMPLVISVILFIFYYIIDNTGYKMARDGKIEVWAGMWLSSAVLLPLGIFFTYKAVHDSALFNKDAYVKLLKRLRGGRPVRDYVMKEVTFNDVVPSVAIDQLTALSFDAARLSEQLPAKIGYKQYWQQSRSTFSGLTAMAEHTDHVCLYLADSRDHKVINQLNKMPVLSDRFMYHPAPNAIVGWVAMIVFPIGLIGYMIGRKEIRTLRADIATLQSVSHELIETLSDNE